MECLSSREWGLWAHFLKASLKSFHFLHSGSQEQFQNSLVCTEKSATVPYSWVSWGPERNMKSVLVITCVSSWGRPSIQAGVEWPFFSRAGPISQVLAHQHKYRGSGHCDLRDLEFGILSSACHPSCVTDSLCIPSSLPGGPEL